MYGVARLWVASAPYVVIVHVLVIMYVCVHAISGLLMSPFRYDVLVYYFITSTLLSVIDALELLAYIHVRHPALVDLHTQWSDRFTGKGYPPSNVRFMDSAVHMYSRDLDDSVDLSSV